MKCLMESWNVVGDEQMAGSNGRGSDRVWYQPNARHLIRTGEVPEVETKA